MLTQKRIRTIEDYISMVKNREPYELISIHQDDKPQGGPPGPEFFEKLEKQKADMKAFADEAARKLREGR